MVSNFFVCGEIIPGELPELINSPVTPDGGFEEPDRGDEDDPIIPKIGVPIDVPEQCPSAIYGGNTCNTLFGGFIFPNQIRFCWYSAPNTGPFGPCCECITVVMGKRRKKPKGPWIPPKKGRPGPRTPWIPPGRGRPGPITPGTRSPGPRGPVTGGRTNPCAVKSKTPPYDWIPDPNITCPVGCVEDWRFVKGEGQCPKCCRKSAVTGGPPFPGTPGPSGPTTPGGPKTGGPPFPGTPGPSGPTTGGGQCKCKDWYGHCYDNIIASNGPMNSMYCPPMAAECCSEGSEFRLGNVGDGTGGTVVLNEGDDVICPQCFEKHPETGVCEHIPCPDGTQAIGPPNCCSKNELDKANQTADKAKNPDLTSTDFDEDHTFLREERKQTTPEFEENNFDHIPPEILGSSIDRVFKKLIEQEKGVHNYDLRSLSTLSSELVKASLDSELLENINKLRYPGSPPYPTNSVIRGILESASNGSLDSINPDDFKPEILWKKGLLPANVFSNATANENSAIEYAKNNSPSLDPTTYTSEEDKERVRLYWEPDENIDTRLSLGDPSLGNGVRFNNEGQAPVTLFDGSTKVIEKIHPSGYQIYVTPKDQPTVRMDLTTEIDHTYIPKEDTKSALQPVIAKSNDPTTDIMATELIVTSNSDIYEFSNSLESSYEDHYVFKLNRKTHKILESGNIVKKVSMSYDLVSDEDDINSFFKFISNSKGYPVSYTDPFLAYALEEKKITLEKEVITSDKLGNKFDKTIPIFGELLPPFLALIVSDSTKYNPQTVISSLVSWSPEPWNRKLTYKPSFNQVRAPGLLHYFMNETQLSASEDDIDGLSGNANAIKFIYDPDNIPLNTLFTINSTIDLYPLSSKQKGARHTLPIPKTPLRVLKETIDGIVQKYDVEVDRDNNIVLTWFDILKFMPASAALYLENMAGEDILLNVVNGLFGPKIFYPRKGDTLVTGIKSLKTNNTPLTQYLSKPQ